MADIQYILHIYAPGATDPYEYTNADIGINPTISKTICSGGYSVGNVATASLIFTIPDIPTWYEGSRVEIFANSGKIMGDWFIGTNELTGFGRSKITCYDRMSKADDYLDFGSTTTVNGTELTQIICDKIGATMSTAFSSSLSIPVADIKSATMRDMLSIMAKHEGCNVAMKNNEIIKIPLYYSGNEIIPVAHTSISNIKSIAFTKTIFNTNSEIFSSGTGTPESTLIISDKYGTQGQADIVQGNMNNVGNTYSTFNCEKCLLNNWYYNGDNILTFADVGDTFKWSEYAEGIYKIMSMELYLSKVGIYATLSADTQKKTLNDHESLSNSSSGGGDLPAQITNFAGSISGSTVNLTWNNPASNFSGVTIKRKKGTPVSSIFDGEIIYANGGNTLTDTLPLPYYDYYYRAVTWSGDYWNGVDNWIKIAASERGKYLYNAGDKCTALTGGWYGGCSGATANIANGTLAFEASDALIDAFDTSTTHYLMYGMRTSNKINFEGFTKVCAEVEITNMRIYDISKGLGDGSVANHAEPYYSYADTYTSSTPAVTQAQFPYVISLYRTRASGGPYLVFFCSSLPLLVYNSAGVQNLIITGECRQVKYMAQNRPTRDSAYVVTPSNFGTRTLTAPSEQADTADYGGYMGGAYFTGWDYVYSVNFTPYIPPDQLAFVGTLKNNSYAYASCISYAKQTWAGGTGTFTIKANIVDVDTSTIPPTSTDYVCVGGFESNTKVKAVWLEP